MPNLTASFVPRVLEIGPASYMHAAFPETTDFYSTWPDETQTDPAHGRHIVTLANLPRLARRLADPTYDLVVVHALPFAPWTSRGLGRSLFRRSVLRSASVFHSLGPQLLRGAVAAPIAVLDLDDPSVIDRANAFLLDRATIYFKRELPPDHWNLFAGTFHWRVPTPRFRRVPLYRTRIAKVLPISLGIPSGVVEPDLFQQAAARNKTTDVFFAGRVYASSTVRERGMKELMALREEGYVIDVPDAPVSREEYLERCARAWIVWSPSGYGWQCFRTYEAALCGSVPLANRSTIEQYRGLIDGEHALYYDVEPERLGRAVRAALQDRERLATIAAAGRAHVLAYHTPAALGRYVAATTLERSSKADATDTSGVEIRPGTMRSGRFG